MIWTGTMMSVLVKKPHDPADSKFSTVEALLLGEAFANWTERVRACANKLARQNNSKDEEEMTVAG